MCLHKNRKNIISYLNYTFSFALLYRIKISLVCSIQRLCVCVWSVEDFFMINWWDWDICERALCLATGSHMCIYDIYWDWPIESTLTLSCFFKQTLHNVYYFFFFVNFVPSLTLCELVVFSLVEMSFVRELFCAFINCCFSYKSPENPMSLFDYLWDCKCFCCCRIYGNLIFITLAAVVFFFLFCLLFFCGQTQNDTVKKRKYIFFFIHHEQMGRLKLVQNEKAYSVKILSIRQIHWNSLLLLENHSNRNVYGERSCSFIQPFKLHYNFSTRWNSTWF